MSALRVSTMTLILSAISSATFPAAPPDFSGVWTLQVVPPEQPGCGSAEFELKQEGSRITGSHSMTTSGCGRMNEGGSETVKGVIVGETAVLVVTSGRNGAIVLGTATLRADGLHWKQVEDITAGEPEGDSPLILYEGVLARSTSSPRS